MINSLNGEYRSIAAKSYDDVLGIMVISWSLATVHHAMYGHFEHPGMLRWVSKSLDFQVSFMLKRYIDCALIVH